MRLGIVPALAALLVASSALTPAAAASDATVTGLVTEAGGAAVADIQVCAYPVPVTDPGQAAQCAFTSVTGAFRLSVPAGSYRFLFTDSTSGDLATQAYPGEASLSLGTPVAVAAGETVAGIDARLVARPVVTGTVTDAQTPLDGVRVCALRGAPGGSWQEERCRYSGDYGRYRIPVDAGTYRIGFADEFGSPWRRAYWGGTGGVASGADVVVTAGGRSDIDQSLERAARIRGTVTVDGVPGADPTVVQVCAFPATGTEILGCREPAADGSYDLPMPPGDYRVGFLPYDGWNLMAQYFDGSSTLASAALLAVGSSDVTGVDATIRQSGRITGTVTGAAEQSLDGFTVCAVSRADLPPASGACVAKQPGIDTFQLGLVPGTYRLWISGQRAGRTITRWYPDAATFTAAEPLVVTSGGHVDVTVELVDVVTPSPSPSAPTPTPTPTLTPKPTPRPTVTAAATVLSGWPARISARKGRATVTVTAAPARGRTGRLERQVCRTRCAWKAVGDVRWPAASRAAASVRVTTSKKQRTKYRLVLPATAWGKAVTSRTLVVRYKR